MKLALLQRLAFGCLVAREHRLGGKLAARARIHFDLLGFHFETTRQLTPRQTPRQPRQIQFGKMLAEPRFDTLQFHQTGHRAGMARLQIHPQLHAAMALIDAIR